MSEAPPESGAMPEQRGDFMLLPPLTPTFGTPRLIQQLPKAFLVTRRPVTVSTEPVGHTIDASLAGRVPGRARRRMRFPAEDLEHLYPPADEEWVEEEPAAPAGTLRRPAPRPRAVARPRATQQPTLPTRTDVLRSVSSPPPAPRPTAPQSTPRALAPLGVPETIPGELQAPPMPPSIFPGVGDSSSVVRRRGGGLPSASVDRQFEIDPRAEQAPSQGSLPRLEPDPTPPRPSPAAPGPTPTPDSPPAMGASESARIGNVDADSTHVRTVSRGTDRTDAPPLQRRRSRGRITTPIVPEDDDSDLPPAVKKMLEEFDELEAEARVPAPQDRPATLPPAQSTSTPTAVSKDSDSLPTLPPVQGRPANLSPTPATHAASDLSLPNTPTRTSVFVPSSRRVSSIPTVDASELAHLVAPSSMSSRAPEAAKSPSESIAPASSSADTPSPVNPAPAASAPDGEARERRAPVDSEPAEAATRAPSPPATPAQVSTLGTPATSLRATTVGTSIAATIPSARSSAAPSSEIRPVLSGRTGIQRRARSRPAPGGSARDTVPSGLAGFTGTPTPRVAGPRRVEVPEQVKQALHGSVGEPPSHVTVHEGDHAAEMTGAVNAEAFTRDGQIFLAKDAPLSSPRGQELLAHELTHVMQQGGRNGSMPGEHTREGQDLEAKALAVEQAMSSGARETIAPKALARPSRDPEEPELHHRRDGGARETPGRSSWTQPSPPPRPQEVVISQPMDMSSDIQRRARDLRSSALSRGLGAVGSALEQGLVSSIEQEVLGPSAAVQDKDSRYKRLERQAADLYPYIRARLRAELVRDRERRGRIARDWS